jgi:hypothetical protein
VKGWLLAGCQHCFFSSPLFNYKILLKMAIMAKKSSRKATKKDSKKEKPKSTTKVSLEILNLVIES